MVQRTLESPWKFMVKEINKILLHFSTDRYSETYHKIADPVWEQEFAFKLRAQT